MSLAAPTGRAAQRMSDVIGEEAQTIHRLLVWQPHTGQFKKNEKDQLDTDFVIIDESSMLDIYMIMEFTHLLDSEYSEELLGFYISAIEIEATITGRNEYKALVRYLKKMAGVKGGLLAAQELKESLLQQYKNRPAMREEFQRLQ